jgi:hypothetical protein
MKKIILFLVVVVFTIACRRGPEETTMKAIADFESDWSTLGQQSINWNKELQKTLLNCEEHHCPLDSVSEDDDSIIICPCLKEKDILNSLKVESNVFQKTWNETNVSFDNWRNKVTGGTINDESANNSLDEFRSIYDTEKDKLQSWIAAYNEAKEDYLDNCSIRDTLNR